MGKLSDEKAKEYLELAKDEIIESISETMDLYGVSPSIGRLYATLYLTDQMNLDEMRDELGMSKPSMSTGIRKLQQNGMVKKKFQRGSRKHTYVAEKNFFHSFMEYYCRMWEREISIDTEAIQKAEGYLREIYEDSSVSDSIREEAKEYDRMLEASKVYYRWLGKLVQSIRSGEIFEFLPKDENNTDLNK